MADLDLNFVASDVLDPRITFSRASLGTFYGADGLLRYAGHNTLWWSEDLTQSQWTKASGVTITADATTAPNGTTTADRLNHTTAGTTNVTYINQSLSPILADRLLVSMYAKAGSKSFFMIGSSAANATFQIWFNLTTGTVGTVGAGAGVISGAIANAGNGWYCCSALMTAAGWGTVAYFRPGETNGSINCTSPGDIYLWGAQAEYVTTATTPSTYMPTTTAAVHGPRIDYDPVTHVAKGLLIEEARTNGVGESEDFSAGAWTKTGVTVTANQIVSPDGTTTADLITVSASPATVSHTAAGITAGGNYVQGVFAKKGTSDWIYMIGQSVDVPKVWFNVNTGVVGTIQSGITSASIQAIGNGWFRCQFADIGDAGGEPITIGMSDADNSATATVGRTVYLWGAQGEPAAFLSSYIPSPGSGNTRAADVAVMTGTDFSSWYNQSAGTFVVEGSARTAINGTWLAVHDGTANESITIYDVDGTGSLASQGADGGAFMWGLGAIPTYVYGTQTRIGVSFQLNDIAVCRDGGTVATDTAATLPTINQLRIGQRNNDRQVQQMYVRRIQFWNTAKSDAELVTITDPAYVEPTPPSSSGSGLVGSGAMGAFWAQDTDDRGYEASRKRRRKFLEDRVRRVREL
jgi:hypothetical protein